MIQRKQTLFLLAAALLCGLSFVFPIARYTASSPQVMYELGTRQVYDTVQGVPVVDAPLKYPIWLLYALLGAVMLVDVFLFKNRKQQLTILRSSWILILLLAVVQVVTHQSVSAYLNAGRHLGSGLGPVMFFPLGILLFMYMAQRGVQKDEELVRSMDRLR